ncbi:MAG: SMC-Scp complex subunit ScpB [Chloroflexi bacterium]|nr:SMC-Scp complex subunit ScpB [Chloroflexota bacterium]
MSDNQENPAGKPLSSMIEALLFTSASPVTLSQLSTALEVSEKEIQTSINELKEYYSASRYLSLQWQGKRVQLVTSADISEKVEKFLGIETTSTLTQASLEALAIIAYRQPITRPQIDEIRGVNSDGVVRNLLSKGLIEEVGRDEGVGRAILYGTTSDFLSYFGISSLDELPAFDVLPTAETEGPHILKD